MKKFAALLCTLILVIGCVFTFAACGMVEFKVNFVVDNEVYATINTSGNEAITMPDDPQKEGYVFDGWYWDKDSWEKPFSANSLDSSCATISAPSAASITV